MTNMTTNLTDITENITLSFTNETNTTMGAGNSSQTSFDRFINTVYYEVDIIRNSQMIMGTMFLGMVLGMVIMLSLIHI